MVLLNLIIPLVGISGDPQSTKAVYSVHIFYKLLNWKIWKDDLSQTFMYYATESHAFHNFSICDLILENQPSCHIWYFEKYRFYILKPPWFSHAINWGHKMELAKCDISVGFPKSSQTPHTHLYWHCQFIPYSGNVWRIAILFSSIWQKKVWRMNRSAKWLLIVTVTLDGFSLVNHRWFVKFAKLSTRQTFPLYGTFNRHA